MEDNKSEIKSEIQFSGEGSTSRSGQSSSSHLQDKSRDRKNKKRSRSPENDWNKPFKNKDTSERIKIQKTNDAKDDDKRNGNQPYEVMGTAQMPNPLHQRMAVTISPTPTMMHQPPIYTGPYPPYAFGPQENFIDHNQGNYAMMPSYNMMPMPSQWPINNALPIPTSNVEISPNVCGTPVSNGMELMPSSNSGMVPYPYMGMGSEPSTYGMVPPMDNYYPQQTMTNPSIIPKFTPNTPIPLSNLVLTPPLPGEIINRRVKPDGCRTVYVGNLPEKMTQDMVNEIFQMCGSILTIRMSEKHFCHIRFVDMESVEQALLLSEYRIKIENNDEPAYNGKMHVDYATARDDQHDFECRKRQMKREERHRARASPPSPPPMPHYSEHEAISVNEKLRNGETFKEGVRVLMAWFEKGECTRRSSGTFYSMLQSTNSNVKRLANEKAKFEEEMKSMKDKLDIFTRSIQVELSETEKVYIAAKVQKNWDHFSKNQRKHIEEWVKEIKIFSAALITARVEEDMDLDENNAEEYSNEDQTENEEIYILREQLDASRQQLEYAEGLAEERKICMDRFSARIEELERALAESQRGRDSEIYEVAAEDRSGNDNTRQNVSVTNSSTQCIPEIVNVTDIDSHIASLIAIFLNAHPFGANIDYICSYVVKTHSALTARDTESLMRKFPRLFREESTGIGATLEKKWAFVGFKN